MSFMQPEHLRFDDDRPQRQRTPSGLSVSQVIQRSLEAYMNGGRHGSNGVREPLADFIANELRLHGCFFDESEQQIDA
jgi:hypothetical protein